MPKYFDKSGNEIALDSLQIGAEASDMELLEYMNEFGFTSDEGKATVPGDTTPPTEPEKKTAAGDSSLADTSLESLELTPVDKALSRLSKISISEEFQSLIDNIDIPERVPMMQELPSGIMAPTGEFFEKYAYEDYIDDAKIKLGADANLEAVTNQAKAMYLNAAKSDLINAQAEEILEDFDNEIYTPLGRLKKYLSGAIKFGGIDDGEAQRARLKSEVKASKERALNEINRLSNDKAAQETYLETAAAELNTIGAKYKKDPSSVTPEEISKYKNIEQSYNNVYETYKQTNEEIANTVETAGTLEELVDLTGRSYDNLDVIGGRVASASLNFAGNFLNFAKELSPEMIQARITGEETNGYVPMYAPSVMGNIGMLSVAGDKLVKQAEEITGKIEKRQELTKVKSVEDFLEFGLDLFSEQAVNTALTAGVPVAGLGLVAASASGEKFRTMDIEMEDGEKYSPFQFYTAGILYGAGEYITERVALDQFLSAKKALKKSFSLSKTPITQSPTTTIKAIQTWGTGLNREGAAELGSQIIGNAADKYVLDKGVSLWDGVGEAYFSGAVMSGLGFGAPGLISGIYSAATTGNEAAAAGKRSARVIEITNRINNLQANSDLSDVNTQEAVNLLQEEADGLIKENLKSMKVAEARIDELSRSDKRILLNVDSQIWKAKGAVDRINSNENLTDAEKKSLIVKHAETISKLEFRKDDVLANSESSKSIAKAKVMQMRTAAEKDLKFTYINGENFEEAIDLAIEAIDNSDIEEKQKASIKADIEAYRGEENKFGFLAGANQGFPIAVTTNEGAKRNRSVAAHEVAHATLFKKLLEGNADIIGLAEDLKSYMIKTYGDIAKNKFNQIEKAYEGDSKAEVAEELMAGVVELSRRFDLKSTANKTLQGKLLSRWNKITKGEGLPTEIKTGKDVLEAIESFNASFDKGEITGLAKKIFKGEVKGKPAVEAAIKEANANIKFSKDISGAAERAKQVLEKVSSNMDFFDPNSPLIARVLPGMIQAQLAKLSVKGLQFDMDEANSDIIYRLYSNGDINKFDGRGTLYGYINGRISFRIKDMLKASGEGKNDIVEDFNQSDIEDLKGVSADVTTTEQIEERTEAERPTYKPLLDSRMATPELLEAMESKIPRVVATAKNRIDAPVSKNTTVTPFVNEVRLALGKQLDIDLKKAMGGKKDGQLRKWLTSNKKAILENMTTTYLMSAFPAAVQKKVNGVWTSDWKGKKIDRETTAVDKAGRTSGAEMVRRLPNASIKIDDKTFLSFVLEESGNPIRGKKESIAKAVAEEMAIEYINQQMQDSNSEIRQALEANQERLGYERIDNHVQKLALDFERGNVKFSKGLNRQQIRQDNIRASLRSAINLLLLKDEKLAFFEDKNSKNTFSKEAKKLLQAGAFIEKTINGKKKKIKVDISDVPFEAIYNTVQSLESEGLLQFVVQSYFSDLITRSSLPVFNEDFLKEYSSLETLRKDIKDGNDKAIQELAAYESEIAAAVRFMNPEYIKAFGGSTIFGKGIIEKAGQKNIEYLESETELIRPETLAQISHYTAKSTSKTHLINRVIAAQRGTGTAKLTAQTGLAGDIQIANVANQRLVKYMATKLIEAVKKGDLAEKNLLRLLQDMNSNKKSSGFRSLGSLEYISSSIIGFKKGIPYVEHIYPNSSVAFDILSLAADDSFSLTDQEKLGADSINALDKIIAKNTLWATDNQTANTIDVLRTTNRSGIQRMKVFNEIAQAQIFSTVLNENGDLQTLKDDLENKEKVELYTKKIGIKWSKATAAKSIIRPSTKFSLSAPTVVFMVGGPGSGKSSILEELGLINKGYRLVNQDPYLEKYIKDSGLASDEKTYNKEERSLRAKLGWKARKAAEEDLARNTAAKESMVVDGTGASYKATTKKMKALEDAGFEIHMVFVNTSKDVAVQRNRARAERSLADFIVTKTWDSVQESAKQYKEDYAGRFYEINTDNLSYGESLPEAFVNKVNKGLEASGVKFSQGLSEELNDIIERTKGVDAEKIYSKAQARMMGEGKGKYRLFVPASAEDFRGLTSYTFAGKGKQGEADQKFIEDNIITPYTRGVAMIEAVKQQVRRELMALRKADKKLFKMLGKKIANSEYTYDHALRVYMWTQQGIDIPGMDKNDIRFLINAINAMPQLIEMGNAMQLISRQDTWMEPGEHWLSRTLVSDLNGMTEKVGRKKYLQEFIENSEAIFSAENLNKIEAVYGTRHRKAIEDALYSMTNGTNRTKGSDNAQVNAWLNWVNNSTGAIMFFNRRSAILQTLSATNFINWSDNNPLKVAAAFANQPQYWSDFAMIFNSDKLKERRSGLQTDVNQAEIANEAKGAKNKAGAVIAYLLKIGFTPTQIADSFAIAAGGASFYRNRVNTYVKEGMEQAAAEKQAFEDFSKTADEAQQSSDPYLVSQEQRSPLGRLVLAFQNTPMQYTRLMKKSMQDLANRRGDPKTHISKIIYYGAVQNFIFSALQSALFAIIPGFDEEDESEMTEKELEKLERKNDQRTLRIINSMTDSVLKGSGVRGAVIATLKNTITEYFKQEEKGFTADHTYTILQALSLSPPIGSKARKLYSAIQTKKFERDTLAARGFDVTADGKLNLSPAYSIIGSLASALGNVPLDRIVDELNSIVEALDIRNTTWQRIALALGWKTWDVGAKNEEHDLIKTEAKTNRKEEGKAKAKETRKKSRGTREDRAARARKRRK
jgi:shikimate kinase